MTWIIGGNVQLGCATPRRERADLRSAVAVINFPPHTGEPPLNSVHVIEMTPAEQARALETAQQLALRFDALGPLVDRENRFAHELVPEFKASGLAGLTVPKRFGGQGADIATFTRCVQALAEGDPACTLAFNMHMAVVGFFRGMWSEADQARYFKPVAHAGKLLDGAYSETRAGVIGLADTTACPVEGGYRITGRKTWGTLSRAADFHTFNATITGPDGRLPEDLAERTAGEAMFVCPADTPGVRIEATWDALGMRGTGTETVVFENAFVPTDGLVAPSFRAGLFDNLEWQTLSFASVYLGLARRALRETIAIVRTKSLGAVPGASDVLLRDQQRVQQGIGEMRLLVESAASLIETTAAQLNEGQVRWRDPEERLAVLEMPKVLATENAIRVVDLGMRLVGGGSFRRGHILERLYRDVRSGPFHPLTTDQAMELLGRCSLV